MDELFCKMMACMPDIGNDLFAELIDLSIVLATIVAVAVFAVHYARKKK